MVRSARRGFRCLSILVLLAGLVVTFGPALASEPGDTSPETPPLEHPGDIENPDNADACPATADPDQADENGRDDDCSPDVLDPQFPDPNEMEDPDPVSDICPGDDCGETTSQVTDAVLPLREFGPASVAGCTPEEHLIWRCGDIRLAVAPPAGVDGFGAETIYTYTVELSKEGNGMVSGVVLNSLSDTRNVGELGVDVVSVTMSGVITDTDVVNHFLTVPEPGINVFVDETEFIGSTGSFTFPYEPPETRTPASLGPVPFSPATCTDGDYRPPQIDVPEPGEITYSLTPDPGATELAPGARFTVNATWDPDTYVVDVAAPWEPTGEPGVASQEMTLPGCESADLLVEIVPAKTSYSEPDEMIAYDIYARNVRETAISNITITLDNLVSVESLAPGVQTLVASGVHQATGNDITLMATISGSLAGTATSVHGTGRADIVWLPPASVDLTLPPIRSEATCNGTTQVPYTITMPEDDTGLIDFVAEPASAEGRWAPGTTVTVVATLPEGRIFGELKPDWEIDPINPARATFAVPLDKIDCVTATISLEASIIDERAAYAADDTVDVQLIATNTGNVDLSDVTFTTAPLDDLDCDGLGTIAPEHAITCTATYRVTQPDIDEGQPVTIPVSVTGTAPDGETQTSDTAPVEVHLVEPNAGISLLPAVTPETVEANGQEVVFSYIVTNDGNVTLNGIGVESTISGGSSLDVDCPPDALAPGDDMQCTATYMVDQDTIDDGADIETVAIAFGTPRHGNKTSSSQMNSKVSVTQNPDIDLALAAIRVTSAGVDRDIAIGEQAADLVPGDMVTFRITLTNNGNLTLHDAAIQTKKLGDLNCERPSSFGPNDIVACTGTYTLTEGDMAWWEGIPIEAEANATVPDVTTLTKKRVLTIWPVVPEPSLTLSLQADHDSYETASDIITYTVSVKNTGLVPVSDIDISAPGIPGDPACEIPETLDPGPEITCVGKYVVSLADLDAGEYTAEATVTGKGPDGKPAAVSKTVTTTAVQMPMVAFTHIIHEINDVPVTGPVTGLEAGDVITYALLADNTGNVTLTDVAIAASLAGMSGPDCSQPVSVVPGSALECRMKWIVTQDDVDHGSVTNTASMAATAPDGTILDKDGAITVMTIDAAPSINLVASPSPDAAHYAGDVITWTFSITNTGNVTVTDLAVESTGIDEKHVICPETTVAPGKTATCTATSLITQDHIDYDTPITIEATATGLAVRAGDILPRKTLDDPRLVTSTSYREVRIVQAPALTLEMTTVPSSGGKFVPGTVVTWEFLVTNSGNMTLKEVLIIDEVLHMVTKGGSGSPYVGTLAPGETSTVRGTLTISATHLKAGSVTNHAVAASGPVWSPEATLTLSFAGTSIPTPTPIPTNPAPSVPESPDESQQTPTPAPTQDVVDPAHPSTPAPAPTQGANAPVDDAPTSPIGDGTGGVTDGDPVTGGQGRESSAPTEPEVTGLPSTGQGTSASTNPVWIATMLTALVLIAAALGVRRQQRE